MTPDDLLKREWPSFTLHKKLESRPASELLVLPVLAGEKPSSLKEWDGELALAAEDFKGKEGELLLLYKNGKKEKRLALLGLGDKEKISKKGLQKAFSELASKVNDKELSDVSVLLPTLPSFPEEAILKIVLDSLLMGSYYFPFHKGKKDKKKRTEKFHLLGADEKWNSLVKEREIVGKAIFLSQDLINGNADTVTPTFLGKCAEAIGKKVKSIKVKVWPKKEIEKEGWGLLLAVNQGSIKTEPVVIEASYKGKGKSLRHTLLVGKGVTFDTGGLNLKPTGSMETMKCDMSGAAISLATMYAAALLELPVQLSLLIPSTENGIGPESFKPGDVYTSYLGKTVEIGNTDAEGRLILADALAWGEKNLKPDLMIDLATLTGACAVALGPECAGLFSPNNELVRELLKAADQSGEGLWPLPLIESYIDHLKSHVADISNSGQREGGAISAALFLKSFVDKTPWAHLDIAGCAFTKTAQAPYPKHATGYGVRMLIDFLKG